MYLQFVKPVTCLYYCTIEYSKIWLVASLQLRHVNYCQSQLQDQVWEWQSCYNWRVSHSLASVCIFGCISCATQ